MKKAVVIASLILLVPVLHFLFPLPDKVEYSTVVTDHEGNVVHSFLANGEKWRMKTELEEISPLLQQAIIEKEDKWFYYHPGVNPIALVRAFFNNLFSLQRTSGASTITMQVAKMLERRPRTILSKCIEIFRAFQLEWKYSKKEILQLYLNLVPYGGNIEGVKSASVIYFKKGPGHLSLAEIMALAVIPNRPSQLVIGKNNDAIIKERNRWLERFGKEGIFSAGTIRDALEEPLTAERHPVPREIPHLARKLKSSGGTNISSNIRMNIQWKVEKLVKDYVRSIQQEGIRNAAVIIIDNRTGQVVSYIGSADFYDETDGGQVNGAAAVRQPGSTLKPLLYGLCIDAGFVTPRTVLADVAINYDGYAPENYDRRFNGAVTMTYALEQSLNVPAVKCLRMLGKDRLVDVLSDCGFQQVARDRRKLGLSMILGGCGTTLEELTTLFTLFAHEGKLNGRSVLSPAAAFMISESLSRINRPDFPLSWQSTEKLPKIAWKTGTSYGRRDAWSIGYNKRYTIGVWTGNFSGKGVPGLSGAEIATPLLFRIFNSVDYDSGNEWFEKPADCDSRIVCAASGLPPGEHCTDKLTDYFIPLRSAAARCEHMREVWVSADESISYCVDCLPENGYRKKIIALDAPELYNWYAEQQVIRPNLPPHNGNCTKIFRQGAPLITSPGNNAEYMMDRSHPEPLQLTCNAAGDIYRVYWYVNDRFYKAADARTSVFFTPSEGPVKISCSDDKGRNSDIHIRVTYY